MAMNGVYNFSAHLAHRHVRKTNVGLTLAMAKMSAGRRVLAANDDAAALAIGARLGAEVGGLHQAQANVGQAAAVLQVADGGMTRINEALGRMKALAVQARSGQLSASGRNAINSEFQALSAEIDRIAGDTDFAGTRLLDGSAGSVSFRIGTGSDPAADEFAVALDGVTAAALSLDTANIATKSGAEAAIAAVDAAIDKLQGFRAGIGAGRNRLDHAAASIATTIGNTESARSRLIDLDIAAGAVDLASKKLLNSAGLSMIDHANRRQKSYLRLVV